eukprot:7083118-Pyramimonas_sp.AAC.1
MGLRVFRGSRGFRSMGPEDRNEPEPKPKPPKRIDPQKLKQPAMQPEPKLKPKEIGFWARIFGGTTEESNKEYGDDAADKWQCHCPIASDDLSAFPAGPFWSTARCVFTPV